MNKKLLSIELTDEMREAGAQRLVSFEKNSVWPHSFSPLQRAAARNEAKRVWRSTFIAASEKGQDCPVYEERKG